MHGDKGNQQKMRTMTNLKSTIVKRTRRSMGKWRGGSHERESNCDEDHQLQNGAMTKRVMNRRRLMALGTGLEVG